MTRLFHRLPDAGAVDHCVAMDQDVAEGNDLGEVGDLGRKRRVETRQLGKRLAENLELPPPLPSAG
jgi:hypothetical protein